MSSNKDTQLIIEPKETKSITASLKSKVKAIQKAFTKFVIIKLCVAFVLATLMGVLSMQGLGMPTTMDGECIIDLGFKLTNALNKFFHDKVVFRNILLITAGLVIDFVFFYVCIYWALFNKSWRLFITMGLFYSIRGTIQSIYQMSFPKGFTWEYPGFPSVVVSYLKTNDFFYSGHVGMPMICFMEFRADKKKLISYFCLFVMLYEGFIVLISRVHYSIDIFVGMFFSQYLFIIIDTWCNWFTEKFSKRPSNNKIFDADIEKLEPFRQEEIIINDEQLKDL